MAALSALNPTIIDLAKSLNPDNSIAKVVEMLHQKNPILDDATWIECNDGSSHVTTVRTGLPAPTWRKLYQYVDPGKSTRVQVVDNTGTMEAYGEVDKALVDKYGAAGASFRLSEDSAQIEGMNQEMAQTLLYGNEGTATSEFTGIAPRYNSLSAANGGNIIDAAGNDTDLTSIYLATWGPQTGHMIYPKNLPAGLESEDLGRQTAQSGTGLMEVLRSHYRWGAGFVLRDWRYWVRIANIDISTMTKAPNGTLNGAGTGPDLLDLMSQALELLPDQTSGRVVFYASQKVRSILRRQVKFAVAQSTLSMENIAGRSVVMFDGVPVHRLDSIVHTETRVT